MTSTDSLEIVDMKLLLYWECPTCGDTWHSNSEIMIDAFFNGEMPAVECQNVYCEQRLGLCPTGYKAGDNMPKADNKSMH